MSRGEHAAGRPTGRVCLLAVSIAPTFPSVMAGALNDDGHPVCILKDRSDSIYIGASILRITKD